MATLQQNLQRPFYIKHLLERLRYGKAAAAMRREAAELIEKMNEDSSNLSAQNSQQAMEIDELKERAEKAESALSEYNKLRESTYAYYLQAERELAAANARADAVSDALDYLKGLTPQKYADLRKDAERYRWLRVPGHNLPISHEAANVSAEAYDAAIDAAIAAREEK